MILEPVMVHSILESSPITAAVQEIIESPGAVWEGGPNAVWVSVLLPTGMGNRLITVCYGANYSSEEHEGWEDFRSLAERKAIMSARTGHTTRQLIFAHPLLLQHGDCLYVGGVPLEKGEGVGSSGLNEDPDELTSFTVANPYYKENYYIDSCFRRNDITLILTYDFTSYTITLMSHFRFGIFICLRGQVTNITQTNSLIITKLMKFSTVLEQ